ncbi:hypothetical protein CAEBREN_05739 [Caenorhabditis brenneri]|uniref:SCP domain-containing protein n=1 Tax=Caenorhabditis brenneri TaxID=135651 RepID=G0N7F8_CAEBE|nr:hypothetical protein CAEBREN_05739 [Caenorhabditis brenneri]
MRVDIVSTSILLVVLLSRPSWADDASTPIEVTTEPIPTEAATDAATEATSEAPTEPPTFPPTAPPTVPPTVPPTTPQPVETTTLNANITLIDEVQKNAFITNTNLLREKHLMGRYAYRWTWDDSLVQSAMTRIIPSCEVTLDHTDVIKELVLDAEEWKKTRRDKKSFVQPLRQIIYTKGAARVGCVERSGCGDGTKNKVYFCHFGPSKFSSDPDFDKGSENCVYDETYSALCVDSAAPIETTPIPVIYKYVKAAMRVDVMMIIGMVATMIM